MRKLGLDIHGVIDANPALFADLTKNLSLMGWRIYIITGPKWSEEIEQQLKGWGIRWDMYFSIVEYHEYLGTKIELDEKGRPWMDPYLWDKTKAEYCEREGIDLHIDDSDVYGYFFKTPYSRFFSKDGTRQGKMRI